MLFCPVHGSLLGGSASRVRSSSIITGGQGVYFWEKLKILDENVEK